MVKLDKQLGTKTTEIDRQSDVATESGQLWLKKLAVASKKSRIIHLKLQTHISPLTQLCTVIIRRSGMIYSFLKQVFKLSLRLRPRGM